MKSTSYQQALWKAMKKFFDNKFYATVSGKSLSRWNSRYITSASCLMSYAESDCLCDAFEQSRQTLVSMFPQRRRPGGTYQGFVKARRCWTDKYQEQLLSHLRKKFKQTAGKHWLRRGWAAFAVDGTGVALPRTEANQEAFGVYGRDKAKPQIAVTTLYHMGTGLPWAWRHDPANKGERPQLRELLPVLPENSLLVADAGYTGFDLFWELHKRKINFLIRVGSGTTLIKELGGKVQKKSKNLYWYWPTGKYKYKPLLLRLIRISNPSGADAFLVTNVLDHKKLSDRDVKMFYQMRWGIEVFFRSFKQTCDNHKLRSKAPAQVQDEFFWAMVSMLLLGLMSVSALIDAKKDPLAYSVAMALRHVRQSMITYNRWRRKSDLSILLKTATKDEYKRLNLKDSRDYPKKKRESPPKPPTVRYATDAEKRRFKRVLLCA